MMDGDETLAEGCLRDGTLVLTVSGRLMFNEIQDTRLLTEGRTDTSCELREGIRGIQQPVG